MIDSSKIFEKLLQKYRFKMVIPYLKGSVLDFGGNKGELKKYVKGEYTIINYDHTPIKNKYFDTIVALAVIEHIEKKEVTPIFIKLKKNLSDNGKIFITTPTKIAKPVLDALAYMRILDKKNIEEHKHYWNKKELFELAKNSGLTVYKYKKFQIGFNQMIIFQKNEN